MPDRYSFIARVPDEPGTLHRVAELLGSHAVNINRIQYDHRIDRHTVFFEVTGPADGYARVIAELEAIGYLQTRLPTLRLLTLLIWLPHRPGGLFGFLQEVTDAGANIVAIDFDDRGVCPERVELTLNLSESTAIEALLDRLKARYRLEIVEYDPTTRRLDDTIYYVRLAEQIRDLIGDADDRFLLCLLQDINHVVQELQHRGRDPARTFETCLAAGRRLRETQGDGFFADVQQVQVSDRVRLWCFQLPCRRQHLPAGRRRRPRDRRYRLRLLPRRVRPHVPRNGDRGPLAAFAGRGLARRRGSLGRCRPLRRPLPHASGDGRDRAGPLAGLWLALRGVGARGRVYDPDQPLLEVHAGVPRPAVLDRASGASDTVLP